MAGLGLGDQKYKNGETPTGYLRRRQEEAEGRNVEMRVENTGKA